MTPTAADAAALLENNGYDQHASAVYLLLAENAHLRGASNRPTTPRPARGRQHRSDRAARADNLGERPLSAVDAALIPLASLVAKELVKVHGALPGEHKIRAALAAVGIRVGTQRAGDLARAALQEQKA